MIYKSFATSKIILTLAILLPIGLLLGTAVSETIVILLSIFFLIHSMTKGNFDWVKNKFFYLLIFLWFSLILNFLFAINQELALLRSFGFIKYVIYIFAIKHLLDKNKNKKILFTFLSFVVLITSFDIYFEYIYKKNIFGFRSDDPTRIASFLRGELKIAHFLLGFALVSIGYYFEKCKNKSYKFIIAGYVFLILLLISIFLTGERANSIRSFICIFIFAILVKNNFKLKKLLIISIVISPIIIYFSSDRIRERFDIYLSTKYGNENFLKTFKESHHGAHYFTAFEIFKSYPIFGIGNKNFREECSNEKYNNKSYARISERCSTHPHQIYLELISEHGIIGSVIILFVIFYSIFKSFIIYIKKKKLYTLGCYFIRSINFYTHNTQW